MNSLHFQSFNTIRGNNQALHQSLKGQVVPTGFAPRHPGCRGRGCTGGSFVLCQRPPIPVQLSQIPSCLGLLSSLRVISTLRTSFSMRRALCEPRVLCASPTWLWPGTPISSGDSAWSLVTGLLLCLAGRGHHLEALPAHDSGHSLHMILLLFALKSEFVLSVAPLDQGHKGSLHQFLGLGGFCFACPVK